MLLIALGVLTASMAMGQSFSADWYVKSSGKLHSKVWHSPGFSRMESYMDDDSGGMIMIFDHKEMKATVIDPVQKTCFVMTDIDEISTNRLLGYDLEVSESHSKLFLGVEDVEGKECMHYEVKNISTLKTGAEQVYIHNYWVYEPLKTGSYNGAVQEDDPMYGMLVMRNISMGALPASLFEIPAGYKTMALPAEGLLELITGKPKAQNNQEIDNTMESLGAQMQDLQKKLEDVKKSEGSQEDMLKSLMEMFQ